MRKTVDAKDALFDVWRDQWEEIEDSRPSFRAMFVHVANKLKLECAAAFANSKSDLSKWDEVFSVLAWYLRKNVLVLPGGESFEWRALEADDRFIDQERPSFPGVSLGSPSAGAAAGDSKEAKGGDEDGAAADAEAAVQHDFFMVVLADDRAPTFMSTRPLPDGGQRLLTSLFDNLMARIGDADGKVCHPFNSFSSPCARLASPL